VRRLWIIPKGLQVPALCGIGFWLAEFMRAASPSAPQSNVPRTTSAATTIKGKLAAVPDFSSDVGRIKFGFSHEEIDDSSAYYEGQFKLYQRCGEGTLHSPETGSKYVGQFQADQFHGMGDQTWSDGSRYIGQWKNGQKNGSGVYIGVDRLRYEGQWQDGRRHGQGAQEYCNGDKYKGWWIHGLCSGTGVYHFTDGSRYEGAWSNGRYDGPGMFHSGDGQREKQWHSSGLLMKREVLPAGAAPKTSRRASAKAKIVWGQSRDDMHKPTVLPRPQPSKYLIRRETFGMDLSAPMLRPKTASTQAQGPDSLMGFSPTEDLRPSTAGGDSLLAGEMLRGGTSGTCNRKELDSLDNELEKRGGHYSA